MGHRVRGGGRGERPERTDGWDLRITVGGEEVFAVAIDASGTDYRTDYRMNLGDARVAGPTGPPITDAVVDWFVTHDEAVAGDGDAETGTEAENPEERTGTERARRRERIRAERHRRRAAERRERREE